MMDTHHRWNVGFKPPIIGFILSVILTVGAYELTQYQLLTHSALLGAVAVLSLAQALVQLIFFLHLGIESKPRWNLLIFLFMVLIAVVLVGGSLWIMANLNYHMMPTME